MNRYFIRANFQDANMPGITERANTEDGAFQEAHSIRNRFAGLKSIHIDDTLEKVRHVGIPTADGLSYLFTVPLKV